MITICSGTAFGGYKFHEFNNPKDLSMEFNAEEAISLEASGEELLFIYQAFKNLPQGPLVGKDPSNTWWGDHAKFIVSNYKIYEFMKT